MRLKWLWTDKGSRPEDGLTERCPTASACEADAAWSRPAYARTPTPVSPFSIFSFRLEVVGDRELCFFPGKAAGCIYPGFEYESEDGAVAAPLRFRYSSPAAAAAVAVAEVNSSNGSGSGSEAPVQWEECIDYVNGGPAFLLLDLLPPQLTAAAVAAAVQAAGAPAAGAAASQLPALQQQLEQVDSIEVLATFPEHSHAAAAVRCRVGSRSGRAVLCSSHPELHPSWLSGQRPSSSSGNENSRSSEAALPELVGAGCAAGSPARRRPAAFVDTVHNRAAAASSLAAEWSSEEHVQRLQAALTAGQQQRWRFWRSLLAAAGLAPWMLPQ